MDTTQNITPQERTVTTQVNIEQPNHTAIQQEKVTVAQPEIASQPGNPMAAAPLVQQSAQITTNAAQQHVWATQLHTNNARNQLAHSISSLGAEDGELIEKPWVDKTEEIIKATKDDPHQEDELQQQLNRTYLKKRFNLDVR